MTNTEADDKKVVALAGLELLHHEYLSFLVSNHLKMAILIGF